MTTAYWPWWLGALALGGITLLHWRLTGWSLGVSGSWGRVLGVKDALAQAAVERAMKDNAAAMQAALMAETMAEFGDAARTAPPPVATPESVRKRPEPSPWSACLVFLGMMAVGGLLGRLTGGGGLSPQWGLGATHERFFGTGAVMWATLAVGGVLVGFGTRMAGGCTTGHGLSGTARLQPGSLISTASFLGAAVAVSFLLEAVVR